MEFPHRCISIDLEVGKIDGRIRAFAAVRTDTDRSMIFQKGNLTRALAELDQFAKGADFVLGHNLIAFDLSHLAATKSDLRLLKLPAIDTLKLNPLAFPRNPYHHLVKHYQDPHLKRGHINDPELDARLALEVFRDQCLALETVSLNAPDLALAWHWLTSAAGVGTGTDAFSTNEATGFDALFSALRRNQRPSDAQARAAISRLLNGNACQNTGQVVVRNINKVGWPLAYALAWLSVAGGNSVMPPWVRHQQALDEHILEAGNGEVPVDHFIEWLAEWGRDVRRRQRGLLLSTAHRAKGLEFDHIVVLDGGWNKVDAGEDPDAPRRLYYVAMTRARQTLALVRFQESRRENRPLRSDIVSEPAPPAYLAPLNPAPYRFPYNGAILHRKIDTIAENSSELSRQYRRPTLSEVNLGFAGRRHARHPLHRAIAALSTGDQISTRVTDTGTWELLDRSGMVVGRLAEAFEPPQETRCTAATVYAVVTWSREASEPGFREHAKCDTWEVVVPELVFEPDGG